MLGASRISYLSLPQVVAPTQRTAKTISTLGNAQTDTTQYKFGGSSYLGDGTGDGLSATGTYTIGTGDFTIECWARLDNVGANQMFFDCRPTSTNGAYPGFFFLGSNNRPYYYFNTAVRITADSALSTNTWYHLAIVRSSGVTTMYIDGTAQTTTYSDSSSISFSDAHIGISNDPTPGQSIDGFLDEIRISDTARYTSGFTPSTTAFVNDDNTLLLIHADGTDASTNFIDDNGDREAVGISAHGNAQIDTANSKFGGSSLLLDGTGDFLTGSFDDVTATGAWTIECWAYNPGFSGAESVFTDDNLGAFYSNNGTMAIYIGGLSNGGSLTSSTWQHLAWVSDGTTIRMFIDGVYGGARTSSGDLAGPFHIGSNSVGVSAWSGHLDEMRISSVARYPGTTTFTPPTAAFEDDADTMLLLHMDGTDASTDFVDDNGQTG